MRFLYANLPDTHISCLSNFALQCHTYDALFLLQVLSLSKKPVSLWNCPLD